MTSFPFSAALHSAWSTDLTAEQLHAVCQLRAAVFIVEQSCAYQDLDGRDLEPGVRHFWMESEGIPSIVHAYLRLLVEPDGTYRIGRVCTARAARGRGLSRQLMDAALVEIGEVSSVLEAQTYVAPFYASFGFEPAGPEYVEDGIPHIPMRRPGRMI